ncbi:MAG: RnfABCDGE type electron transport complex subunit D, partial [Oscillospiraceae bacterium]
MNEKFVISCSPHIRGTENTSSVMRDVLIALLPALFASVWLFGFRALMVTLVCTVTAVGAEYIFEKGVHRPITIGDLSAAVTGVILAFNLPSGIPLWEAAIGAIVAIVVVKQLFGGLGQNFANPAITARIVLLVSFAGDMTTWAVPKSDIVSGATPLAMMAGENIDALPSIGQMFLG